MAKKNQKFDDKIAKGRFDVSLCEEMETLIKDYKTKDKNKNKKRENC